MKHTGIHILDFNDKIIDYISREDGALISTSMSSNVEDKSEIFDFTVLNERAENLRERNRIITQDNNGVYREFIISHVVDNFDGTTDIESNASYFEDIDKSKPVKPGEYNQYSASQSLEETLRDTGWEVADSTEYNGMKTSSWDNYSTPYEIINILCDTYGMVADYYIELGSNTVEHRYVSLHEPYSLFKGKEITKGKDLTGMTRTVDMSEVRTALYVVGPEVEGKKRFETIITDDDAQAQFGLPERYLWDIFEPETSDDSLSQSEIVKQAKEALNQKNKAAISYDISSIDIHKHYPEMTISLRDTVRIKDRDFRPPLYIEAEVIGIDYDLIQDESTYKFGNVVEYKESNLRAIFDKRLSDINKKLNDNISNVNTIVNDVVAGELEYYERKIFKGAEPPENPQEDVLWYDTSNPNVAVLRRYRNGKWQEETVSNVEQIGGVTREKALYSELNNTFINLGIQHSKLMNEVYDLLNNEYLVDTDLRDSLSNELNNVDNIYNSIKDGLDSINPETATIGRLIDIQALFGKYRQALQSLYRASENAKDSANARLKLLQSQYTDEKFNNAMESVASTLPNGRWDSKSQILYADIPNKSELSDLRNSLQEYADGKIQELNTVLGKEIDSKIKNTKDEISANVSSIERKIDGIEVGGRNLIRNSEKITDYIILSNVEKAGTYSLGFEPHFTENIPSEFGVYYGGDIDTLANDKPRITHTFEVGEDRIGKDIRLFFGGTYMTHKDFVDNGYISKVKLEYGDFATDYTLAPEDLQNEILVKSQEISKAQADAAETRAQAYADSKITNEEQARIRQADANVELLQQQQKSLKNEMAAYTDNLINEEERARMDADKAKEEALQAEINLAQTQANAYADNKITAEEKRAIEDAQTKFEEAKKHAEEKAAQAQSLANEYAKTAQENAQNYADNKINNLNYVSRNLLQSYSDELNGYVHPDVKNTKKFISDRLWATTLYSQDYFKEYVIPNETYTIHYEITIKSYNGLKELTRGNLGLLLYDYTDETTLSNFVALSQPLVVDDSLIGKKQSMTKTFKMPETFENDVRILSYAGYSESEKGERVYPTIEITNLKLEKGTIATDWTPAPEDYQRQIKQAQQDAQEAAQAYANAQDELKETNIKAYADGIVSDEEKRAIADAENKLKEAKTHAEETAEAARKLAEQNASIDAAAKAQEAQENAQTAAEAYAKAQDELKQTETKAYADGIVSDEEKRAIADAIAKRDEAKEYAEQKAQEAQEAANQNTSNQLKPITTRVTKNEANITELDNQISLMAKSDDVAQKLRNVDGRLTPLETTVKSNKATLDILPTQIESKVSKQDYTLDKNEIVQRLDNADSQRKQLSNEITDKVTITKFESGMTEAKNYTDNIKEQATTYTDNKVKNLSVGGRNYILETDVCVDKSYKYFPISDLTMLKNETYTLSIYIDMINGTPNSQKRIGGEIRLNYTDGTYEYFSVWLRVDTTGVNYSGKYTATKTLVKDVASFSDFRAYSNLITADKAVVCRPKLEKGSVATDWTPAPEDVETLVKNSQQEAEKSAQTYADAQDNLQLINAKAYADGIVSDEEKRAIADAESKLETAKADAQTKADAAKEAAQSYALAQAQTAQTEAEKAAKAYSDAQDNLKETQLKAYADGIVSDEEKRAIADAESKLQEAKSHAEKTAETAQQTAQNYTNDEINNLDVGSENLLLDSESRNDGANTSTHSYIRYYLTHPLEIGKTYTLKADVVTTDERQSGQTSVYPYYPNGTRDTVDIKDGKITYTFTAQAESTQFLIYKDVAGQSNVDLNVTIEKAILVEGDKVTGWAPANEDVKKDIQQAETNAKAYTDEYKRNNEVAMTKLETSVSQLDGKVSIKVDEQKFNASQKTLSKVLTEIAATTSGINLTYDNNGTIQGVTVDNGGVKLRGDKVDITVNDEFKVMANRVSNVQTDVSNKVNKDDIINRLNLSPEGLDIDVNKVGIRGGDSTNYIKIQNSGFLSYGNFKRYWSGEVDDARLELGINNGRVLIRNQNTGYRLYLTERGLSTMMDGFSEDTSGTLEFHSTRFNDTSRGITMHSTYGAVAMLSEQSRAIVRSNLTANIESYAYGVYIRPYFNTRPGINEFNFYVKSNDNAGDTDGAILFGEISDERGQAGSGIRFKKKGLRGETDGEYEPMVYATDNQGNIGTGSFYANKLYGDWTSKNTNLYAAVDNELRVTDKATYNGGSPNYKDLRVNAINTTSSYAFSNHSGADVYFGVGYHELRITANNHYNGGNPSYQNIRFGKWYAMSSEKFKYDIKEWNYSVLDAYRNDLQLYSYKYKSEKDSKYIRNHHGVIIERELPIEWRHGDGFDGNEVMFWNTKAIQELLSIVDKQSKKIEKLEEKLNG